MRGGGGGGGGRKEQGGRGRARQGVVVCSSPVKHVVHVHGQRKAGGPGAGQDLGAPHGSQLFRRAGGLGRRVDVGRGLGEEQGP